MSACLRCRHDRLPQGAVGFCPECQQGLASTFPIRAPVAGRIGRAATTAERKLQVALEDPVLLEHYAQEEHAHLAGLAPAAARATWPELPEATRAACRSSALRRLRLAVAAEEPAG